jgi:hypothetical protein
VRIADISATFQDKRYLTPLIEEVQQEKNERDAWDTVKVKRGH